jgi:hypothetical protein
MGDTADSDRRSFHPTPGHFLAGLLAVEGLLFLSERFHWFAFNTHKGWTVLIALASVGVFLLIMLLWFLAALVFRCWFQFSIRSLLVLTVAVALSCSWLATEMKAAKTQKDAARCISALGSCTYDDEVSASASAVTASPPRHDWLRRMLGCDFFASVTGVSVHARYAMFVGPMTEDGVPQVIARLRFEQLRRLDLADCQVTDAGLKHLADLASLESLSLDHNKVTDAGLVHLAGLTQLKRLDLGYNKLTDAGLVYLGGLTQLKRLDLSDTSVTDVGLRSLEGLEQLEELQLTQTGVSDAGLGHIEGLKRLQSLDLFGTAVTDAGLEHLKGLAELKRLGLSKTQVTDAGLKHLKGLSQLQRLYLFGADVTDNGAEDFRRTLPNCKVWR